MQGSEAAPAQPASEIIAYLDRRGWMLADRSEEKAFRCLLRELAFLTLMQVAEHSKAGNKPLTPATLYKLWLDEADPKAPGHYAAWYNLGVELAAAGDAANAALAYRNALLLKPDLYGAAINLGLLHENQNQPDKALETWHASLQPDDVRTALLNQRGRLLETLGRFAEAEAELFRSLLTNPRQFDAHSHWLHIRLKMCAWPVFGAGIPGLSPAELVGGASGLSVLALFDDNAAANRWVTRWLERKLPAPPVRLSPETGYKHDKIRVGYLSSDYCLHPISMLTAELFERHDRERFEVYGYCSSRNDGSDLRRRVLSAFDKVTVVSGMTDEQAARAVRADEIDILVDLNGLTEGARMGVVRWRPAPVQLTYLGYVGSLPVPELDYVIADEFVVPPDQAADFHPKPLMMPRCYQVNDSKTPIGAPETRDSIGLPTDKFVYTCFSNTYKITEEIFECWMKILAGVDNSVLWVLARNPWARENMCARAELRGISRDRLIFADPTSPAKYLARLALADVFLDTFPYNSGTTASDALRMGLPMVTLSGKTFSSRMAGSLLRTVGLEAGITRSFDEYVDLAIALGRDPAKLAAFRDALKGGAAWRETLGDTERFVRELEDRYRDIAIRPKAARTKSRS